MDYNKRATIKDVARIANVSTATVSHVINRTRFVSDAIRDRVLAAVEETNYTSNSIARALRSSKTHTIGVVIPDISNPSFSSMVYHMEMALHKAGYMMIMCDSRESLEHEKEVIARLCASQVDGIIVAPVSPELDYVQWSVQLGKPFVFIDRYPNSENYSGVFCSPRGAIAQAVEEMILAGHRRIALLNRDTTMYSIVREREDGYRDALEKHGIAPDPNYIFYLSGSSEFGYAKTADILRDMPEVDGIYCANRHIALGALQCLIDRGVRIPEAISIAGYATYNWHNVTSPRLATVLEPLKEMGEAAARLMLDVLDKPEQPPEKVILNAYLHGYASIGPRRMDA
jgi:LacI family transcriptional regulator